MLEQKLAAALIVKATDDEAPLLTRALMSISGHVDDIYVNLNHKKGEQVSEKIKRICETYDCKIYETEWEDNFAKARNFIYSQVPKEYDWIFWIDSDDVVDHPEQLKDLITIAAPNVGGIYADYDYAHDQYGNVTYTHKVLRLTRNNGAYAWRSSFDDGDVSVHETLQEIRTVTNVRTEEFKVIHKSNPERGQESLKRNIVLLQGMYEGMKKKGKIDPRILFYLATHYFEAARNDELLDKAEDLLIEYLKVSGWAEERSEAWVYLGLIFRIKKRNDAARQAFGHAILENPVNPKPYVELGELEFIEKRYMISEEWLLTAISKKQPTTSTVVMPMENQFRAYMLLAQTYINMGFSRLTEAAEYVEKALKLRPTEPEAKAAQELILNLREVKDNTKSVMRLVRKFEKDKTEDRINKLLEILPDDLQDNPAIIKIRINYTKPKKWPKKSVVIFCGNSTQGIWGPNDLDSTGMGGSEEAVIHMSNQLTKLGYSVTVYATPGEQAGSHNGVEWKQYWEFNPKDEFDTIVVWRQPLFFDADFKARKKFLWLHDVMDKEEFTQERLEKIDKCLFVSQYHADLYKDVIPDNKRFVSGNGVEPVDFEKLDDKFKRDSHRCIYTSSQLRGLEILYDIWPDVKKSVPDATLDAYYGWETYTESLKNNPERMAWKDKMIRRAEELDGVTDHGRIGQAQMNEELSKSGVFAYPCIFPEVYCISLIKAQAAGVYPVTSDFAVLKDFNVTGEQVHYDPQDVDKFKEDYKNALIKALKSNKTQNSAKKIRRDFSWQLTAEGWSKLFK